MSQGKKISVVLAINEYRQLLEDLQDLAVIADRKLESSEDLGDVKARIQENWLDTGSN